MAFVLSDRVKEISTTAGTGALLLDGGTAPSFSSFLSVMNANDFTYYGVTNGVDWETGYGQFITVPSRRIVRTTVFASSNNNALVDWPAGGKEVFITLPAKGVMALNHFDPPANGEVPVYNNGRWEPGPIPSPSLALDALSDVSIESLNFPQDGDLLVYSAQFHFGWCASSENLDGYYRMPNMPTSDPLEAGVLWNDLGTVKVSAG